MAGLARRTAAPPALKVNARLELQRLELEFGGRQHLVQALTFAKQTKDVRYVLGLLADPENDSRHLADVLADGRILPGELVDALASGAQLRSQLLAKQKIAQRIPVVVGEVMERAAEYEADCSECLGIGTIVADPTPDDPNPSPQTCTTCRGAKRLKYAADPVCRDQALEMAGLTGNGGPGVHVSVQQNVGVFGGGSYEGYERMQEAMDTILYGAGSGVPEVHAAGDPPAVDAELVQPPMDTPDAPGDTPQ